MSGFRVLVVVGTRPEAIKMAPVVEALRRRRDRGLEVRVALTGQHTELVDQALDMFGIVPDYDLEIMREGQSLYDVARGCLDGLREVVRDADPDVTLVQGDTATVFFGSLVTFFEKGRVGHVEAGLRSDDKWAPFPEEVFRRLTDVVADFRFAPTLGARDRLLAEDVPADRVFVTGNTVVDALLAMAEDPSPARDPTLRRILEGQGRLVLVTAHRRESFGEPLRRAFGALRRLVEQDESLELVYPVHPNPNVVGPARELLAGHPRIHLLEPLGYTDVVKALERAELVLTDSGGIQEEAPTFGTPVLVLRDVTERPEGVETGVARLVGTDPDRILGEAGRILAGRRREAGEGKGPPNPYGDGRAGERIADIVTSALTGAPRETEDWSGPAGTPSPSVWSRS